jgi:hypothetical protein
MLRICFALICSRTVYGSFVYGSAKKSKLSTIDSVHSAGIHFATGIFRTTLLESLYVVSGEPLLSIRKDFLCIYVARLATQPMSSSYRAVFHPTSHDRHRFLTSAPRPVGVCLQDLLQRLGIMLSHIIPRTLPLFPPWDVTQPYCELRLSRYTRGVTPALMYCRYSAELLSYYPGHTAVYTDDISSNDRLAVRSSTTASCPPISTTVLTASSRL